MSLVRRTFATKDDLAAALADDVADALRSGIAARGRGSLAVSGGSTPARFFTALSTLELEWDQVVVTLVDERWVDETSERSNGRLVRANLLRNRASAARFVPLYQGGAEPDARAAAHALKDVPHPLDAVVLGMGNDGHTASFFPGGDNLALALSTPEPVVTMRAPGAGEPRVTLSLAHLLAARHLFLHIEGDDKQATLARAEANGPVEDMPVRSVLRQSVTPLTIFWCP